MRSDDDFQRLVTEFPLLLSENVIWYRELLAHYGLLFNNFGLLEFTIQMCLTHKQLISWQEYESSTPDERNQKKQTLDAVAIKMTFGQMVSGIIRENILLDQIEDLKLLRDRRNYFAHHFFRENYQHMSNDESAIEMILRMSYIRRRVIFVDRQCTSAGLRVNFKVDPSRWVHWNLAQGTDVHGQPFPDPASLRGPIFGWEKDE